ncbi:IclR family transcriptional regulator [Aminithiophilus ramosus]|uniref:IclR family transcriptional regulator n=1 Tax=Aminithiophilus ramosus TaxID=3029084 RepID=A0A9Q7EV18_9BACT|nr:IclR family transcriptional regulator [Aminithiophilus ramosus]QTX32153.1 IclR family transcriptional regulator [Aminithiophilus ramosus]
MSRLDKGLQILRQLSEPPFSHSLASLASAVDMTKGGVHKVLSMLVDEAFVAQDGDSKLYRLGPALYRMGVVYANEKGLNEAALPVMELIGKLTKETVSVGIRDGDRAFLALSVESPHLIRLKRRLGVTMPPNAGAIGKLLAAYHDPQRMEAFLRSLDLAREGRGCPAPFLDVDALLEEYAAIRRQGYALSLNESVADTLGLSVPVPDRMGRVWACLCIAGPRERLPLEKALAFLPVLRSGAEDITARLS